MKSYYKSFNDLYKYTIECEKEIEKLKSIIKEVREYIIQEMNNINAITYINILEILDKENDNGER